MHPMPGQPPGQRGRKPGCRKAKLTGPWGQKGAGVGPQAPPPGKGLEHIKVPKKRGPKPGSKVQTKDPGWGVMVGKGGWGRVGCYILCRSTQKLFYNNDLIGQELTYILIPLLLRKVMFALQLISRVVDLSLTLSSHSSSVFSWAGRREQAGWRVPWQAQGDPCPGPEGGCQPTGPRGWPCRRVKWSPSRSPKREDPSLAAR